jgi:hypothetical protein
MRFKLSQADKRDLMILLIISAFIALLVILYMWHTHSYACYGATCYASPVQP